MITEWTPCDVTIVEAPSIRDISTSAGATIDFTLGTVRASVTLKIRRKAWRRLRRAFDRLHKPPPARRLGPWWVGART